MRHFRTLLAQHPTTLPMAASLAPESYIWAISGASSFWRITSQAFCGVGFALRLGFGFVVWLKTVFWEGEARMTGLGYLTWTV